MPKKIEQIDQQKEPLIVERSGIIGSSCVSEPKLPQADKVDEGGQIQGLQIDHLKNEIENMSFANLQKLDYRQFGEDNQKQNQAPAASS